MATPKKTPDPRRVSLTPGQVQDVTLAIGERDHRLREYQQADARVNRMIGDFAAKAGHTQNGVLWEFVRDGDDVALVEVLPDDGA